MVLPGPELISAKQLVSAKGERMKEMNNGGPAFPSLATDHRYGEQGMTLRDYFAAAALTGCLAASHTDGEPEDFARVAYGLADAMLKAKEANP